MTSRHPIYPAWISILLGTIAAGIWCYLWQLDLGLGLTGMSRDVSWGLYIGQFTFADGLAASAALLVLPYYYGRSTLYAQFLAIAGVVACMLFIVADMGRPSQVLNVLRYASPHSLMFWDMVSLNGFLVLNGIIAAVTLDCERKDVAAPGWLRGLSLASFPWAIGMQTVAAFLYGGLPGRSYWLTALLAPRFIVSALASGPALLTLVLLVVGSEESLDKLRNLVRYALLLNVFFIVLEVFTTFYSGVPEPMEHFPHGPVWTSVILALLSLALLRNRKHLVGGCLAALSATWIDKAFGMLTGGFVPSPLGSATPYVPSVPEVVIAAGIWAAGALIATLLFRAAIKTRAYTGGNSELLLLEQEVSH